MTPMDLARQCKTAIEAGRDYMSLVVPGSPPKGETVRIDRGSGNRSKCPMGEVLSCTEKGTVALFDPIEVLAWLTAIGVIEVVTEAGRESGD